MTTNSDPTTGPYWGTSGIKVSSQWRTCSACEADPGMLRHFHLTVTRDAWTAKNKELDALRAENERLKREVDYWMNLDAQALEADNERLRADQRLLDESVRNQAIREAIHKEELKRLRAALEKIVAVSRTRQLPEPVYDTAVEALGRAKRA